MSQITKFNKTNLPILRVTVDAKLAELTAETGIHFSMGTCSYDDGQANFKLDATIVGDVGSAEDANEIKEKREFSKVASMFGLDASHYRFEFTIRGEKYRIIGIKPRSPRYPFLIESLGKENKVFKMTKDVVTEAIKEAKSGSATPATMTTT